MSYAWHKIININISTLWGGQGKGGGEVKGKSPGGRRGMSRRSGRMIRIRRPTPWTR